MESKVISVVTWAGSFDLLGSSGESVYGVIRLVLCVRDFIYCQL